MRWALDLRHRLLVMILLVLLPAALIIAYDVYAARSQQIDEAQRQGQQVARSITNSQERLISHVEGLLELLARVPQVRNRIEPDCSAIVSEIVHSQPRYSVIHALDTEANAVCSSNPEAKANNYADRAWFKRALTTGDFTIGDYIIGRMTKRPVLGFALPLKDSAGKITGIVYASIDLDWFVQHEVAQALPENADFTLVDEAGLVMARYPDGEKWSGKSAADTPLFTALQKIDGQADLQTTDLDGNTDLFHLLRLQRSPTTAPIYIAIGLEIGADMRMIDQNTLIKIALLLCIAAAIALVTYLTSARMISRPIRSMVDLSSRIAGGDLSVRSGVDHDAGEFGTLARSLDSMAQALEKNQQQLIEQQQYMRAVLDNISEIILAFDSDKMLVFSNAAARAAGLPSDKVSYQNIVQQTGVVFDNAMQPLPTYDWPLYRVIRGETLANVEIKWKPDINGEPRTVLVNGQPIQDDAGRGLGYVCAVRDITDLRATEATLRQAQKMEAVGQLTGGVAHDFNNLLSVVIGNIDSLLPHLSAPGDIELANEALNGALRGAALTRQMLAFARRQALDPKIIDLRQHLPQMATMLRRTLGESISVVNQSADDLWTCLVDPGQLDSVLLNFAINARDAMPQGGTLTIEAKNTTLDAQYAAANAEVTPGDYIRIALSDNGEGITPEILGRVMEPFFTTKAPGQGTGLGLSMAFGFAKQSGGHLKIYSEVGHGTTINLYLPRATGEAVQKTAEVEPAALPKGRETILLVDDNEAVRKTAARQLIDLGYQVIEAEDAKQALDIMARGTSVDLLFSDVVMPGGLSGFDLAAKVTELYPPMRILLVTGFAEAAIKNGVAKESNLQVMSKPYRRQELAERLRALLDA
nr:cache domain-containing protein [uncultured Dongia sp.]